MTQATPTGLRSVAPGSSTSAFRCVQTPISFSPGITSSSNDLLLARPTFSGITVPGKTTILRIGRIGRMLGSTVRCPLVPVRIVVLVAPRSMIWLSDMVGQLSVVSCGLWVVGRGLGVVGLWVGGWVPPAINNSQPTTDNLHLGNLDPQHPISIGGGDFFGAHVRGQLDLAAE